jgi:hypothetical protein
VDEERPDGGLVEVAADGQGDQGGGPEADRVPEAGVGHVPAVEPGDRRGYSDDRVRGRSARSACRSPRVVVLREQPARAAASITPVREVRVAASSPG